MTIVEVLIVMALIGVISLPVMQMLYTGQRVFVEQQSAVNDKSMLILMEDIIKKELRMAKTIKVVKAEEFVGIKEEESALYIKQEGEEGQLVKKTSNSLEQVLLDKGLLNTRELTLNFKLLRGKKQVIQLELIGGNYQIETALKLYNLVQSQLEAWDDSEGEILIYTK